jgi:predicted nucleotidyltransferase
VLRQRSYGSVKIISIDQDELLTKLSAIAKRICAGHPEVKSVRVFGSVARGDHVGTSDVDAMVVLYGDVGTGFEQIRSFYRYFDLPVGVDVLVFSEGEIARRLEAGDTFVTRVWKESRSLCERT